SRFAIVVADPEPMQEFSSLDAADPLVVTHLDALPVAQPLRGHGPGRFVNGWAVNGVSTFQSGTPITVFDGSTFTLQDLEGINGTNFATLAPGATLASAVPSGGVESRLGSFLNLNAFTPGGNCVDNQNVAVPCQINGAANPAVAGAAIGNVGRNAFRGPFQQNWDLSITKNTKVTEATSVDFRSEEHTSELQSR